MTENPSLQVSKRVLHAVRRAVPLTPIARLSRTTEMSEP